MKTVLKCLSLTLLALVVATTTKANPLKVDVNIADYVKVQGVAGNLNSVGSDTLNNMMTFWAEGFRKKYPNVNIQIEGKGSSTAPPALIAGTSQLGPMSRKMKDKEEQKFEAKYGFKPTAIGVALDSLAVFINKDNPIDGLSLQEVDGIFSKNQKCGMGDVTTWGQLGLTGEWANKPISLYGRNSASGTYGYFKSKALCKGDYKDTVKEQPGSASVVLGVTEDKAGVGYSGIGYKTSGVKAIALGKKQGDAQYEPTYANVMAGKYPLGRMLFINVVKEPNKPLPTLVKEFLKFALSKEGQEIVIKDGYLPLTADLVKAELAKLD